jgi:5'-phosphate synthase pdxT subunit
MAGGTVGVLALQGGFDRHQRALEQLGAEVTLVRTAAGLDAIDALIIPGGESTTMLTLLAGCFFERLRRFVRERPILGTCAGAILLSREVHDPPQPALGALDITIRRNAYGRQANSAVRQGVFVGSPMEMVFIRAPRIERVGAGVEVLAHAGGDPVLVRHGRVMAATFHPELSDDTRVFRIFLEGIETPSRATCQG